MENNLFCRCYDRLLVPSKLDPIKHLLSQIDGLSGLMESRVSGVYFLINDSEVVYVGQSVCVGARVANHLYRGDRQFNRALYLKIQKLPSPSASLERRLDDEESFFIKTLTPVYNARRNGRLVCPLQKYQSEFQDLFP